jgi:hypothetical protein
VAFGRNYAPAVEFKFQLYVSVTLCIFMLSALANTLGSWAMASQEQQPLDFIAVGCARAVGYGVPIIVQVFFYSYTCSIGMTLQYRFSCPCSIGMTLQYRFSCSYTCCIGMTLQYRFSCSYTCSMDTPLEVL